MKRLGDRRWLKDLRAKPAPYNAKSQKVEIVGDLLRDLRRAGGAKVPAEQLPLRYVYRGARGRDLLEPNDASPVILLGDSHTLVFHLSDLHGPGAGLAEQLAVAMNGNPVCLVGVKGSGATPARISLYRRGRRTEGFWKTKKLVVWCFSAREFTESMGWAKVPVAGGK